MLEQQCAQKSIEKRIRQGNFSSRSNHLFVCEYKMLNHLYGMTMFHYAGAVILSQHLCLLTSARFLIHLFRDAWSVRLYQNA